MKIHPHFSKIRFLFLALALCGLSLSGCDNSVDANTTATSQICAQITGVEAIYWDLMNGIPRTDIPGGLPTVAQVGGSYTHPTYPALSFIYPTGYAPQTDGNSGWIGVNLFRNDNRVLWRYTSLFYSGVASPGDVFNGEINSLKAFLGSTGAVQTSCSQQGTPQIRAAGIATTTSSALIRFDNFSATVIVSITTESGLGAEQISIATTAAPTAEFGNEILHTFLPIDYQLLYKDSGELDSDNDGYPDSIDKAPFDPAQH